MRYLIGLALRNVKRNTRRSLLAGLSVALAVMTIVAMQGMIGGFMGSMVKNYTKNETGHVRISTEEFARKYRFRPVTANLEAPDRIVETITNDPALMKKIRLITERVHFGVLLSHNGNNKTAMALAGDPRTEKDLLLLDKSILPGGRYLQAERETIMGRRMADALGYTVGDTLKVVAQGSDYALHMRKFAIVGLFETGLKALDDAVFQIPLTDAKQMLRMGDDAQQIVIMLHDYGESDEVAAAIRTHVSDPEVVVESWLEGQYGRFVRMAGSMYFVFYAALALFGSFIIGNIMMMVVLERRHEIGVLKSMGLPRRHILILFLTEGTLLGVAGSIAGAILGAMVCLYFNVNPMDFFAKSMEAVTMPMDSSIRFTLEPLGWLQAVLLGTGVAALLSLLPSWRAAKLHPMEAIKSV
jgi:putative ABC transport system permease protein